MATALEVEWDNGVVTAHKGWRDLDHVMARAQATKLVQETPNLEAFKAVWRVRDVEGRVAYYLINHGF